MSTPAEIIAGGYVAAVLVNDARSRSTLCDAVALDTAAWLSDTPEVRLLIELFGKTFVVTITERQPTE